MPKWRAIAHWESWKEVIASKAVADNFIEDQDIRLTCQKGKQCPIILRRIRSIREEDQKELTLISNDLTSTATELMALYKQRWEIELFFKWIKQNLQLKRYMGTSEHAVQLQILIAMISYLLLRQIQNNFPIKRSHQQITWLLVTNLFYRGNFEDVVAKTTADRDKTDQHNSCQLKLALS